MPKRSPRCKHMFTGLLLSPSPLHPLQRHILGLLQLQIPGTPFDPRAANLRVTLSKVPSFVKRSGKIRHFRKARVPRFPMTLVVSLDLKNTNTLLRDENGDFAQYHMIDDKISPKFSYTFPALLLQISN
jgi:hypothetical protein